MRMKMKYMINLMLYVGKGDINIWKKLKLQEQQKLLNY